MDSNTRREFLQTVGLGTAALTMGSTAVGAAPAEKLVLGIIGPGGMGMNHTRLLSERPDVTIAYVCDVDSNRLDAAAKEVEMRSGKAPHKTADMRQVFDDQSVDAVFIATPDHWHAPSAILALDAGKHVYVEKPCCHNVREGRAMVEAVRRSGKKLQVGTQSRSTPTVREAIDRVRSGEIGEVLVSKAWNSQLRRSIGKTQPADPPPQLDFDSWIGPAQPVRYRSNLLHGVWRWWYDFGCGDIGNDGVHDIDVALWGLGVESHPDKISCLGGKNFFDDDQQFPDTQYAVCEYPAPGKSARKQFIFEQRIWSPYVQEGYENGAAFYGTNGMLIIGHTVGWKLYGPRNKLIAQKTGSADLPAHHQNFFDCIRGVKTELNADVDVGFQSAAIVHLANISARMGRALQFDPEREAILNDEAAHQLLGRTYRAGHWAVPKMFSA